MHEGEVRERRSKMSNSFRIRYCEAETAWRAVCDGIVTRARFQETHVVSVAGLSDVRIRIRLRPSSHDKSRSCFLIDPGSSPMPGVASNGQGSGFGIVVFEERYRHCC
jgi:hypothetical protein